MTETPKSTCTHCGKAISLVPWGKHHKWVDGRMGWHCGNDPQFPTRAHAPASGYIYRPVRGDLTLNFRDGSD